MIELTARVPLAVQIGAVAVLFAAASASLWHTGAEVVEREARRATARQVLDRAGEALARVGADDLADAPAFPYTLDPRDWDALDGRLSARGRFPKSGDCSWASIT